jgi:protoheme IX farnesyltransferase
MLFPVSLAPFFLGFSGMVFLIGASILGVWFLWVSFRAARTRSLAGSKKLLLMTVIYLPLLFVLMVADKR